jgi:hypothetical protein
MEKQFAKGFNSGYLIAKHQPDLFAKIEKNLDSKNEFVQGLLFGKEELEKEKKVIHLKDIPAKSFNNKKNIDRER